MTMKLLFLPLLIIANSLFGQSNYEKFKKLFQDNDTTHARQLLESWERINPHDAEFYACAFNFYFSQSKKELISLEKEPRGKESLQITDSTGRVAGFMNSGIAYNPVSLKKAFDYIDKGIDQFPDRLDLRFGKCFVLGQLEDYQKFTDEIIKTVTYSKTIKCNWLWTENIKVDDPEKFMLGSVQAYLKQLYDTENDDLLVNLKQIGDLTIEYYPNCVEVLSTTAVAYLLTQNYDKAIGYLQQAERADPKDFIVLENLAQAYRRKGDKQNAIKYFELVLKYGDEDARQEAQKFIKELKSGK